MSAYQAFIAPPAKYLTITAISTEQQFCSHLFLQSGWRLRVSPNNLHLVMGTRDVNLPKLLPIKCRIYRLIAVIGHLLKLLSNKLQILSPTHLSSVAGRPSKERHQTIHIIHSVLFSPLFHQFINHVTKGRA